MIDVDNIRSSSEIAEFDPVTLEILNRWPSAPGQRPNGLSIDAKNRRLFSGCNGNSKMIVMDADKGTVLATVDIGRGSDGCGFDGAKGHAYRANGGDGTDPNRVNRQTTASSNFRTTTTSPLTAVFIRFNLTHRGQRPDCSAISLGGEERLISPLSCHLSAFWCRGCPPGLG